MSYVIYALGWAVAYFVIVRLLVRDNAKKFPGQGWDFGDTLFAVMWSPFAALFWPLLALFGAVAWLAHRTLRREFDRTTVDKA